MTRSMQWVQQDREIQSAMSSILKNMLVHRNSYENQLFSTRTVKEMFDEDDNLKQKIADASAKFGRDTFVKFVLRCRYDLGVEGLEFISKLVGPLGLNL